MAAPSLSTASPDPRNPDASRDSQPVTPAKAGVHVEAGLDSRLRGNDGEVDGNDDKSLNRRALLAGGAACAVAGSLIPVRAEPVEVRAGFRPSTLLRTNGVVEDPALLAYARVTAVESWLEDVPSDEDDPRYVALLEEYDRAEAAFADTRATTPAGVRAKLNHVAYLYAPDAEGEMCRSSLATSIVADFAHILAASAS